ncbi:hypothetical protein [Bdellovibrio bacteriovorus]|uniref:hypothetical protein n=1 Tax=Bdellovibrio bacteriovorus TaxID=959 RepID=UPI0035A579F2
MNNEVSQEVRDWLNKVAAKTEEGIRSSSVYAGIVTENFLTDPLCILQLGYALVRNKPIALIVHKDCQIPESLVKVAKVIERVDLTNPADLNRATESIAKMVQNNAGEA